MTPLQALTVDVWRRAVKAQHPVVRRRDGAADAIREALASWLACGPDLAKPPGLHAHHVGLRARELLTPTSRRSGAAGVQSIVPRLQALLRANPRDLRTARALERRGEDVEWTLALASAADHTQGEDCTIEALDAFRAAWALRRAAPAAPTPAWLADLAALKARFSSVEIAALLGVNRSTVERWHSRAGSRGPTPIRARALATLVAGLDTRAIAC